jgi:hypothetical protein
MNADQPPTLAIVEVAHQPRYVIGFPAYVALTVMAQPRSASVPMPAVGWMGAQGSVGVSVTDRQTGRRVFHSQPLNIFDQDLGQMSERLHPGERRRVLIDLDEVLPETLRPGSYDVRVSFGPETLRATSAPVRLNFRDPTARERTLRAQLAAELEDNGSWGQWTYLQSPDPKNIRRPWGRDDPLRFNWIMRELIYGDEPLGAFPLERLDALDGMFEPEREALRAEILKARGETAAAARQIAYVKHTYPALTDWMNRLIAGQSDIAWARHMEESEDASDADAPE